ncbi:MAG: TRAP transporter large permease subunit, partial [Chitinophagaceae bacterium]|nr:TRAP transporter large permease subunit [Rubrivivax sp.]
MSVVSIGALLLLILLLLLTGGVWIAMALAIVGWVGQFFFTTTPPGKNLFTAFWETTASWELAALPLFIWMGEILFRTKLSE